MLEAFFGTLSVYGFIIGGAQVVDLLRGKRQPR